MATMKRPVVAPFKVQLDLRATEESGEWEIEAYPEEPVSVAGLAAGMVDLCMISAFWQNPPVGKVLSYMGEISGNVPRSDCFEALEPWLVRIRDIINRGNAGPLPVFSYELHGTIVQIEALLET